MAENYNADTGWDSDEMEASRGDNPSGWLYLAKNGSVQLMIDAFLDAGTREFNKTELGDYAGVSRQTVDAHIDRLTGLGVVEEVDRGNHTRYRFNPENPVSEKIIEINGTVVAQLAREETSEE